MEMDSAAVLRGVSAPTCGSKGARMLRNRPRGGCKPRQPQKDVKKKKGGNRMLETIRRRREGRNVLRDMLSPQSIGRYSRDVIARPGARRAARWMQKGRAGKSAARGQEKETQKKGYGISISQRGGIVNGR